MSNPPSLFRARLAGWIRALGAALALLLSARSDAQFFECVQDPDGNAAAWECACESPDGSHQTLPAYCCTDGEAGQGCGGESPLYSPDHAHAEHGGYYTCCLASDYAGCRAGDSWGGCGGLPCQPGQSCHSETDQCQEGICVSDPPQIDTSAGDYSGHLSAHCQLGGGGTSSCDLPQAPPPCRDESSPVGPGLNIGDPVHLPSQTSRHDVTDTSIRGSIAEFSWSRSYVSSEKTWAFEASLGRLDEPFLPKPFGSARSAANSLRWWHSLYSLVFPQGWTPGSSIWSLREGNGELVDFVACSDGNTSCFATPTAKSSETRSKLYWQASGGGNGNFIVFKSSRRYFYQDIWLPPASGVGQRFFLSRIEDGQYPLPSGQPRVLAQLSYSVPDGNCPGQSTGSNPGVPYLGQVTNEDGATLLFHYKVVPTFRPDTPQECVLASVSLMDRSDGGESAVVQYAYTTDGGVEMPGLLASSTWPLAGTQSYQYAGAGITIIDNGTAMTVHDAQGGDKIVYDYGYGYVGPVVSFGNQAPVSCDAGTASPYCQSAAMQQVYFSMSRGDGHILGYPPPDATRSYLMESTDLNFSRRVKGYTDSCTTGGALCDSTSPGTVTWLWSQLPGSNFVDQAIQDKRGAWTAYAYALPQSVPADAGFLLPPERTAVYKGAVASDGSSALEVANYSYAYGGTTQTPRAFEQLLGSESHPSVLQSGQSATRQNVYDTAVNRLKAVIKSGYTQTFNGTTWTNSQRYIGTFYFTNHACLQDTDDALGRTLEIHGPCLVAGPTSSDCDVAPTANTPITQYFYWPSDTGNNNANRLQKVSRFPTNGGPTACSNGTSLDTLYDGYDARGNPTRVTDPNLVVTVYTYEENRVKSQTIDSRTTTYGYEYGKLTSILHPEGNYDLFCYRFACSPNSPWTGQLMEKRKALWAPQGPWMEGVTYEYSNNQRISEVYWTSNGLPMGPSESRRERHFDADGRGRPTWETAGISAPGQQHFDTKRLFDGADNLAAIGLAFNLPPDFCKKEDNTLSPLCAALSYDRANRLIGLDERPVSTGSATRTCMTYDVQGNVKSVVSGCSASGAPGDCSSCTQPLASYQYDDFGNVVSATLPWTDNGSGGAGTVRYDYDARGDLLHKQTPAMASSGDYLLHAYDALGRELSLLHFYTQPTSGNETLYSLGYDNSASLDGTCPPRTNTLGRMLYRNDSFGQTWYQYDVWGEVTQEIRLRQGTSTCSDSTPNANPHTTYAYSPNGNLTSIVYPYGRTVAYTYATYPDTSITTDRISSISITTWNGSSWVNVPNVISNVAWEPFGELRGYQINHPSSGTRSAVEYFLGQYSSPPPPGTCPAPSGTFLPFDLNYGRTGLVQALWVSGLGSAESYNPGNGNGSILKMNYTWAGDQVAQVDTCLLDATVSRTEQYSYDQLLRLKSAARLPGNFAATGGAFDSRSYGYDGRGNRTAESREDCGYGLNYGNSSHPDQLTRQGTSCASSILSHSYAYDRDGRVTSKNWENDSSLVPAFSLGLSYGESDSTSHGALDTVFKAVSVNGVLYNYFYDAQNRRRMKVYPLGATDEFFYDMGHQLLVDQGNDSVSTPTFHPDDNYVWLGGRPVMLIRGKLSTTWTRQADTATDCGRNGEAAACGVYFPVTDHIGKPVLMLDNQRKVAGTGEYDVFGQLDRVSLDKETPHPYVNNYSSTLADFTQPKGNSSSTVRMRVLLHQLDTEDNSGDVVVIKDGDTGQQLAGPYGGYHRGQVWTDWVQPQNGHLTVNFSSDGQNCCPNGSGGTDCTCPQAPNFPYTGVVMEGYEYRRIQTGASALWTPLRFPGQYFDSETDLFENWNRYYESGVGKYLEPEPILEEPEFVEFMALQGHTIPAYAYALNNPLLYADSTGLAPDMQWSCKDLKDYIDNMTKQINKRWEELKEDKDKLPICKPGGRLRDDKIGHLAIILKYHFQRNAAMILYDAKGCGGGPPAPPVPLPFPFAGPFPESGPFPFAGPFPMPVPIPIP